MSDYNYATFDIAREEPSFAAFGSRLHAGDPAPSFPLEDLNTGEAVEMTGLWARGPAVLEFGSFT